MEMTLNKGKTFDVVKFLTKQNLSFSGHWEGVSSSNLGNFIELVELMSKYDSVLGKHFLKEVKDNWRYLSPKIQNEFIFAIMLDNSLDISHTDQMSFICRGVVVQDKEVDLQELFFDFITEHRKTAYDIKKMIWDRLEKLEFKKCRGRGFPNTVCRAEVQGGVQRFLRNINGKAKFVPCSNHSLNLCGFHASAVTATDIIFFGVIERLYTFSPLLITGGKFFSSHVDIMNRLVTIRWSARYEAIRTGNTRF